MDSKDVQSFMNELLDDPFELMLYQERLIENLITSKSERPRQKVFVSTPPKRYNPFENMIKGESNAQVHDQLDINEFIRSRVLPAWGSNRPGSE